SAGDAIFPTGGRTNTMRVASFARTGGSRMTAAVLLSAVLISPTRADEPLPEGIPAARMKAIDYLKKQQKPDGTWEGITLNFLADMEGGATGLVALALLEAGVKPDDPAVKKAI